MNLKNKTDKELWDTIQSIKYTNTNTINKLKHKIYQEIIRREKNK